MPVPREPQKICGKITIHAQESIDDQAHLPTTLAPHKEVRIVAICAKFVKAFASKWKKHPLDPPPPTHFGPYKSCFSKLMVACSSNTHQHDTTTGHYFLRSIQVNYTSQADIQHALRYLHSNAHGDVDKLSIKDNFNTLIESTHGLVWATSRTTRALRYKLQDTEPRPVWRLLLAYLEPTPYGFVLENIDSQTARPRHFS